MRTLRWLPALIIFVWQSDKACWDADHSGKEQEPSLINYQVAFSKGMNKMNTPYTDLRPVTNPHTLESLLAAIESRFLTELANLTWGLESGEDTCTSTTKVQLRQFTDSCYGSDMKLKFAANKLSINKEFDLEMAVMVARDTWQQD